MKTSNLQKMELTIEQALQQGVAAHKDGKLQDAERLYRAILHSQPTHPDANHNLGVLAVSVKKADMALPLFKTALEANPKIEKFWLSYIDALIKEKQNEVAKQVLEQAKKQGVAGKKLAEAHNNLGNTLKELGRLDEAEASYTQAIALKPDFAAAHSNLGNTLKALGRLDEAEASFRQTIALKADFASAHNNLLTCLYLLDKKSLFFDELDYLINQDTTNAVIGSLTCRSALKYGLEKPNLFCREPLKYVLHIDLNTRYDFEEIFVEKAKSILNENWISNRKQSLLVNGYQTSGNLFDIKNDFTDKIQKAIRLEIEKYRINFKNSEEGLIKKWPTEYSLYGWLISMKSGGELQPHIHNQGWLSGSIYINVPPKSKADSGNLVVSLGEEKDAIDTRINVKKIINVVAGSLVLFPASLTHYTIPFESEEERIVLAFDVKQK